MPQSQFTHPGDESIEWVVKQTASCPKLRGYVGVSQWLFYRKRDAQLVRMRSGGSTYRELGEFFGISSGRCRSIYEREYWRAQEPDPSSRCSLCHALHGEPHLRIGPHTQRGRTVSERDLGNGIWLP